MEVLLNSLSNQCCVLEAFYIKPVHLYNQPFARSVLTNLNQYEPRIMQRKYCKKFNNPSRFNLNSITLHTFLVKWHDVLFDSGDENGKAEFNKNKFKPFKENS